MLVLVLAVVAAGCSSSSQNAQPTVSLEKQAALNATLDKAAQVADLQGAYLNADAGVKAASFLPPPTLNSSMVDGFSTGVDAYSAGLAGLKAAFAHYRMYLDNGSSEYQQAISNESAADEKLADAADLKRTLGLAGDWLAEYATWKPANDSATPKIGDMDYLASLTDPYHQATPADGVRFFNGARPVFVTYLNESATMLGKTDALIAALGNSTAKDSLAKFKADVESMNSRVKTNYNAMVATFNDKAGKTYGMQAGL
ncbi:MAG TPA: hypothetical protein VGJ92_06770 [Methanocella sp.]|jgi:hypothetical protein